MKKRVFLSVFMALVLLMGAFPVLAMPTENEVVSPGLYVLAEDGGMAKAGLRGCELTFKKDDFSRALNLSSLSSITLTALPNSKDGRLLLGNTVINKGQKISGSNLSLIKFECEDKTLTSSSFRFRPNDAAYDIECVIYVLDEMNYAPTLSVASSLSLNVETYRGVTHFGKLSAYEPDGDELIYEIVSYPKDGILVLNDKGTGEYTYTPSASYVGKDSFSYIAKDKYGNYSAAAEVSLTVNRSSLSVNFDDMQGSDAASSAIKMNEEGIMSGTQIGDGYYFQPTLAVTRSEFVVMAMKALGIKSVSKSERTVFADDEEISPLMKSYISAAYELGYTKGSEVDGKLCFLPDENISRAEAAVIVGRMLNVAVPTITPTFSDSADIPAWAKNSIYSLCQAGVMNAKGNKISATEEMTRADTAKLLAAMMEAGR